MVELGISGGSEGSCQNLVFRLRIAEPYVGTSSSHTPHSRSTLTMDDVEESNSEESAACSDSVSAETSATSADGAILVEDLLKKCQNLLNELAQFHTFLVESKKQNVVEIRHFQNSILSELKSLERVRSLSIR